MSVLHRYATTKGDEHMSNRTSWLRVVREPGSVSFLIPYRILLDGAKVGRVYDGQSRDIAVTPGKHRLRVRGGWIGDRSNEVSFEIGEGEMMTCSCHPTYTPFTAIPALLHQKSMPMVELSEVEKI